MHKTITEGRYIRNSKSTQKRGFSITNADADIEFKCVEYEFNGIVFEIIDTGNHVDTVEQSIRTVKETIKCLV